MYKSVFTILAAIGFVINNLFTLNQLTILPAQSAPESRLQLVTYGFWEFYNGFNIAASVLITLAALGFLYYNFYRLKQQTLLQADIIRQQELAAMKMIDADENERRRIADDLQDSVGQLLSTTRMNLDTLLGRLQHDSPANSDLTIKTMAMVDEGCREVRAIAQQMMPAILLRTGLIAALRDYVNKIEQPSLKVIFETSGWDDKLTSNVAMVLYRMIQETANNVIKHAAATQLDIQLSIEDYEVSVTVEDNGCGFLNRGAERHEGIGLKNILARAEYLKGTVDISSSPGKGTLVAILIPLN
jgi:two-component system NarL family sensor kinase